LPLTAFQWPTLSTASLILYNLNQPTMPSQPQLHHQRDRLSEIMQMQSAQSRKPKLPNGANPISEHSPNQPPATNNHLLK
jgi:hypothetical protein